MISFRTVSALSAVATLVVSAGLFSVLDSSPPRERESKRNRYVGAKACSNCHKAEDSGDQFGTWEAGPHAKAWEVLASDRAKEIAAEKGIEDPQKADECLRCHVTAHGAGKKEIKRGFKVELGVQCESCHGPGELHGKARFAAASAADNDPDVRLSIPEDEIITATPVATCLECHNDQSPTFKPFCFKERRAEIAHFDPRVSRSEEELKELECQCGDDCKCAKGECGGYGQEEGK